MRTEHLQAMGAALGIGSLPAHAQVVDAAAWACMPRRRVLLSTLAPADVRRLPQRRPDPWDHGWGLAPGGQAPAMLRARSRPAPTGPRSPMKLERSSSWSLLDRETPPVTTPARFRLRARQGGHFWHRQPIGWRFSENDLA